jgi:chaperone modulatory protein CbpM
MDKRLIPGSLQHTRVTLNLQRNLGINLAAAALALDLLERIDTLDARLPLLSR